MRFANPEGFRAARGAAVALACSASLTSACSGVTVPIGNNDAPNGGSQGIDTNPSSFRAPNECSEAPSGAESTSSDDDARAQLMGRWLACSEPPAYASTGQIGIEFAVQFNYFKLLRVDGKLQRSTATSEPGIWVIAHLDTGERELFLSDATGTFAYSFIAYTTPPMLRIDHGQQHAFYIRSP